MKPTVCIIAQYKSVTTMVFKVKEGAENMLIPSTVGSFTLTNSKEITDLLNVASNFPIESTSQGQTSETAKHAGKSTSFPGSSLYLEKVPWLRLVTCLLDFSRFQRYDWREGLESQSLSRPSLPTEPRKEWNFQRSRCVDRQKSRRRHWNIW